MWSKLPIIGWFWALILNIFLAIPTYFLWNYVAPKYLGFIPNLYQSLPFWDIVWIVMLISVIKHVVFSGIFNVKSESNCKDNK